MTVVETAVEAEPAPARPRGRAAARQRLGSAEAVLAVLVVAIVGAGWLRGSFAPPAAATFLAMAGSILVAGLPFVVAGAAVSAGAATLVPGRLIERLLAPTRPDDGVGHGFAAVLAGVRAAVVLTPGTWRTVPAAADQLRAGRRPAAVVAFLAAAPVVNPVALVATVVAFPGQPGLAVARFVVGAVTATVVGWLWLRRGAPEPDLPAEPSVAARGGAAFVVRWRLDVVRGASALALGAVVMAGLTALAPPSWLELVALRPAFSVVALALFALLLCAPAEVNALLAAALTPFSPTARLVFLTVGPLVDVRRFAELTAGLGPRFAGRLAPLLLGTGLVVAVVVAVLGGAG